MAHFWHNSDWTALGYLNPSARSLLTYRGSLTQALQERFGDKDVSVSLEGCDLVSSSPDINTQLEITDKEITKRVVLICIGAKPYIYAETVMPTWAADELPWLASLENQALGQYLFSIEGVERSEFTYSLFDLSQLHVDMVFDHDITLWARRSLFKVPSQSGQMIPLLVTEVFMHHVAPSIVSKSFFGVEHYC